MNKITFQIPEGLFTKQGMMTETMLRRVSSGAGLFVVFFFFLPWVLVSCSGSRDLGIEASGYEIATGNFDELQGISELGSLFGVEDAAEADATPVFWLFPVFGLLGLVVLNNKRNGVIASLGGGLLGIAGLIIFVVVLQTQGDELSLYGFQVSYRIGYWGSWLAFIVQAGAAAVVLRGGVSWEMAEGEQVFSGLASRLAQPAGPMPDVRPPPAAAPQLDMLARLEFIEGPLSGQTIPVFDTDLLIGRGSSCDVQLADRSVSREHARLRYAQGAWYIQDQDSAAGTFVNGQQVTATRLELGDRVELGDTAIKFQF